MVIRPHKVPRTRERCDRKILGADGIFEVHVRHSEGQQNKAILFQAKNDWSSDRNLAQQALKLSYWREAAFVLNYTEQEIDAFRLDRVIKSQGKRVQAGDPSPLSRFLGQDFLECRVGDLNLAYDARDGTLMWRDSHNKSVSMSFALKSRVKIQLTAHDARQDVVKHIKKENLDDHRMYATSEDILGISSSATAKELTSARNALAATYHPDGYNFDDLSRAILTRRMQEANHAYAEVKERKRRKN